MEHEVSRPALIQPLKLLRCSREAFCNRILCDAISERHIDVAKHHGPVHLR